MMKNDFPALFNALAMFPDKMIANEGQCGTHSHSNMCFLAEFSRARAALYHGYENWVNHPRKFGYDVAYARTLFEGKGRESGVSLSGGGVCY